MEDRGWLGTEAGWGQGGVAVRGRPLGPAEHQGEQASGEPGPRGALGTPELGLPRQEPPCPTPAPRGTVAWPWEWLAAAVSAAPGLTQPGFRVESQGQPPPQDVPSTCLVLRPEQSIGWPGHCPLTHGAHCVWPGSGNSLTVSVPQWGGRSLLQPCAHSLLLP